MKLGEALAKTKILKNKLVELQKLQRSTFFVEEGKEREADFSEIDKEIDKTLEELRELKIKIIKIQKTNLKTRIRWEGKEITLAETILIIGDIRSKLAQLKKLYEEDEYHDAKYERRTKDDVVYIPQKTRVEILEMKKELETKKTLLDNLIQNTNWRVEVE